MNDLNCSGYSCLQDASESIVVKVFLRSLTWRLIPGNNATLLDLRHASAQTWQSAAIS